MNITQYRSAIGNYNNFIKSKENILLCKIIKNILYLIKSLGLLVVPIMANFPVVLFNLTLLLLRCGDIESNPGPLTFCHLNARSLLSDVDINQHIQHQYSLLDEIYETLVYQNNFDVIAISETWLTDNISLAELDLDGYQEPFCRHRGARGGGVMVYVKQDLVAIPRQDLNLPSVEMLWLEIKVQNRRIMFGTFYRAPGQSAMEVDDYISFIDQTLDKVLNENPDMVILIGDFNDKCMTWDGDHSESEMGYKFYNLINDRGLFQHVDEPTRVTETCSSLLDLIISDSPGFIENVSTLPPLSDLDHCVIYGTINFVDFIPAKIHKEVWLYNLANWDEINRVLDSAPWHIFGNNDPVDEILDLYYNIIYRIIDEYIPYREFTLRKKDKPWMNGHLRHMMSLRNRMNGVYLRTLRPDHKIIRNEIRRETKKEIRRLRAKYNAGLKETLSDKDTNIKRFWSVMKQLYGAKIKSGIPTLLSGNEYYSTNEEKAEHFADYFAEQCSLPPIPDGFALPPMNYVTNERLSDVYFDVFEVWDIMRKLNPGKASGPDKISYRFLKECAHSLSRPFCLLFQRSMNDGIFPSLWKLSHISPVYKKLEKHFRENYRPVSLLSCISKVMERVVRSHKHLGVTMSKDMTWNLHIDAITKKAASRLSGINRIKFLITRKARVSLYNALVLPILEYGGLIFDNCTLYLKQRLESIHRRGAIICTCAFRNTSYKRLLGELGWNTLDERRKFARLSLFYKMSHKPCVGNDICTDCSNNIRAPDYLKELVPSKVGERTDYYLRNSKDLTTVKTRKVKTYNSFIPKTVRDWNNLDKSKYTPSLSSFKASYKNGMLRSPNPLHMYELGDANIHHTRLRLGMSCLRAHLFTYNLIDSPMCGCGLEFETIEHYILRCPTFGVARIEMYKSMVDILDNHLLVTLTRDSDIANLFLYGHKDLCLDKNILIFKMAQTYIISTERFSSSSLL